MKSTPPVYHEVTSEQLLNGTTLATCEVNKNHIFHVKRKKVALVFVPGIMGSRLYGNDKLLWDPGNPVFMLYKYRWAKARKRYEFLVQTKRSVAPDKGGAPSDIPHAVARGWGQVAWNYYGDVLLSLEKWVTPLKTLVDFSVYAFGYDWMNSNMESGKKLQAFLESLSEEKIIVITHSMGGLVTRYALSKMDQSKILAVIHGAQPASGAPAAYRRQIAGFEGKGFINEYVVNGVLGSTGPDVTAVFSYCKAGMELLPSRLYTTNGGSKNWFYYDKISIKDFPTSGKIFVVEPCVMDIIDPYNQIYLKQSEQEQVPTLPVDYYKDYSHMVWNDSYYGMIRYEWLIEPNDLPVIQSNIHRARSLHKFLDAPDCPGTFKRTIQLFASGRPTFCEIYWKLTDITDRVKSFLNNAQCLGVELTMRNVVEPLPPGEYREIRWVNEKGQFGISIPFKTPLAHVSYGIYKNNLRIFTIELSQLNEEIPNSATSGKIRDAGDETVPESSASALKFSDTKAWGEVDPALPTADFAGRGIYPATIQINQTSHTNFYDKAAIKATQDVIHNVCVAWLKGTLP